MTDYIVEYYERRAKKPYDRKLMSLPDGYHPSFTNNKACFNLALSMAGRVKIKYASNGKLAAEKYRDRNGNGRLRWKRQ